MENRQNDLQGHTRLLVTALLDRSHMTYYLYFIVGITLFCTIIKKLGAYTTKRITDFVIVDNITA